jgi:hypothetical protein
MHEEIQNCMIIMDNHSTHVTEQNKKILEQLRTTHSTTYIFLPPYSPFLNPIEYAFHHIKNTVRNKKPQDMRQLREAIEQALVALTPVQAKGCFTRAEKFRKWIENGLLFNGTLLNPITDEDYEKYKPN